MMKRALSVVVLCLLPTLAFAAPSIVILNAKVFTGDARNFAEGLAIEGNKIIAVGTSNQMKALAGRETRIINADGKLVIPGINDAHTHPGLATTRIGFAENIEATTEQLLAALQNVVEEAPADFWLVGTAGPAAILDSTLTRQKLDEIAPGRKVMITAFTGHGTVLSTAGLAALGVALDTPDPLGGWFDRDANGKLNGRAHEYAEYDLQRRFGELATEDELLDSIRGFSDDAIHFGITSVQAMPYVNEERFGLAIRNSGVPLRIRNIAFPAVADPSFKPIGTAVKWILDGTPIEHGAALRTARYADHTQGRLNFTDIDAFLKTARDRRAQILLHAAGDKTVAQALNRLASSNFERPRIEHGDGLQQDLYDVAKKAKAIVVLNPTHFPFRGAYPVGQYMSGQGLVKNGIPIAIGSDGPLNPYLNMFFAITREDTPAQKMSRVDVLRAYTSGSAFAEFTEETKGRIAPGMLADVAMLSQDILTVDPPLLADTYSELTIINGKIVSEQ